jgi:hypothetical protein
MGDTKITRSGISHSSGDYVFPPISKDEQKRMDYLHSSKKRGKDVLESLDPKKAVAQPVLPLINSNDSKLYPPETSVSLKAVTKPKYLLPTIGTPLLTNPENRQGVALALTKSADEAAVPVKKGLLAGFFDVMRGMLNSIIGSGETAEGDTSADSPLVGSPKKVAIIERAAEKIAKAMEHLSDAIDKLITEASERAREERSDGNNSQADHEDQKVRILKQWKTEVEQFKAFMAAFKVELASKGEKIAIASDEIYINHTKSKELQKNRLDNAETLVNQVNTAENLKWVMMGAGAIGLGCFLASGAVFIFGAGGAAAAITAALGYGQGGAAAVKGLSLGYNAYNAYNLGQSKAKNEEFKTSGVALKDNYKGLTEEMLLDAKQWNTIEGYLFQIVQGHLDAIRAMSNFD